MHEPEQAEAPAVADDQRTVIEPPASSGAASGEPPAAHDVPLPLSRLAHYELLEEVGRGGMGVVFKARDVKLQRIVAVKMILGGNLARPTDLARFETEAAAAAQLQHPGIVSLFEVGASDNQPYFSMEFVSGTSLAKKVAAGPLSARRAAAYVEALARAVHFAHSHGIVHRDLKPANVLLDAGDQPKITDFGLAKLMSTDSGQTRTGAVLGTPSYMSPEQAEGSRAVGPATDIYSLGAILYELLTGRAPFHGETALATLALVAEREAVPPRLLNPTVDRELETITLKCLEKAPGRRYASAQELADDLHRFLQGEPISARRLGLPGRAVKWGRRKPALASLVAVSATAVFAFVTLQWQVAREEGNLKHQAQNAAQLARVREEAMRHLLYLAEVRRAQQALKDADLAQAERLLGHWLPRPLFSDLRDWEWNLLRERTGGKYSLAAHAGRATAAAFSPDGKRLATTGGEPAKPGEVKIWETATGKLLATLTGHKDSVTAVAYAPQGRLLASASFDKTIKIWDADKAQELVTLYGHTGHVSSVVFSPTEPALVSGSSDGSVRLWNHEAALKGDKSARAIFTGHAGEVSGVAFSPGGGLVASSGFDGTVRLWDIKKSAEPRVLKGHQGEALCVAFSPAGDFLASGGGKGAKSGEVKVWDIPSGRLRFDHYGLADRILGVAFSRGGKLAAAGKDGLVRVWDEKVSSEALSFRGDPQFVSAVAFSPDGRQLSWAGRSGRVTIASTSGGLETWDLASFPVEAIAFSPDNRQLACGGGTARNPRPIEVYTLGKTAGPLLFEGQRGVVLALAYAPNGRQLAAAGGDMIIRIYDATRPSSPPLQLTGHGGRIRALAFHPLGKWLASASDDETIRLWDLASGTPERVLTGHNNNVQSVAFSPDGRWLASGGVNKTLRVWETRTFASAVLEGHTGTVNAVAFSPDSLQLASAGSDKIVRIWELGQDKEYMKLEGSPSPIIALAYHNLGRRLVTVGQDKAIRLWDIVTRQEILELDEAAGNLRAVAFSSDGRYLAAAGAAGVRVWDGAGLRGLSKALKLPCVIRQHTSPTRKRGVSVSPRLRVGLVLQHYARSF